MNKYFLFLVFFLWELPSRAEEAPLDELHQQKTDLFLEKQRLLGEVAALERTLRDLSVTNEEKKATLTHHREEIAKKLPLVARLGRANPLRILVDSKSGLNTLRSIILVRAFMSSLNLQLQNIQAELNEVSALSNDLEVKAQSLAQLLQGIEFQQAQLAILGSQKIEDVKRGELDRLKDVEDVNTLLNESRAAFSKKGQAATTAAVEKGLPFRWLERPVVGKIVKDPVLQKKFSPNGQGIIFETPKNAEVLAPSKGTVVFKGPFRSQGDILILDHGEKVYTVFMGMHKIDAEVGQNVYAGEKLGMMAGYGAKPPTLYLELRQKGKAIDPKPYFAE